MIPRLSKRIVGAKIVKVVSTETSDYGDRKGDGNSDTDIYTPTGEVFLKLDNGLILKCWNSEWGGLQILDPEDNSDKPLIAFVEKGGW